MERNLKQENKKWLAFITVANLFVISGYLFSQTEIFWNISELKNKADILPDIIKNLFITCALPFCVGLFTNLLPRKAKEILIFAIHKGKMPSSRAFTQYIKDERVDEKALRETISPLPGNPKDQTQQWLKLYYPIRNNPIILDNNKNYLLWREAFGIVVIFEFFYLASYFFIPQWNWYPSLLLLIEMLMFAVAAYNSGVRLVVNTLYISTNETRNNAKSSGE